MGYKASGMEDKIGMEGKWDGLPGGWQEGWNGAAEDSNWGGSQGGQRLVGWKPRGKKWHWQEGLKTRWMEGE